VEQKGRPQFRAEDLPGPQAVNIYTAPSDFGDEAAAFTSTQRKRPVGFLDRHPSGTIGTIYVRPAFRGKGIAGRMWTAAGEPPHSNDLTPAGNAWRQKVGGEQPEHRGEVRHEAEPLHEKVHQQQILPLVANEIKSTGRLTSRAERFHGA
jgi:GNAT superfamily N-acetyltransferase